MKADNINSGARPWERGFTAPQVCKYLRQLGTLMFNKGGDSSGDRIGLIEEGFHCGTLTWSTGKNHAVSVWVKQSEGKNVYVMLQ